MGRITEVRNTVGSRRDAEVLADLVVGERLAACAQVSGPLRSTYWWKGKMEVDKEWQVVFKTTPGAVGALVERIKQAHPYEIPEIVVVEVDAEENYQKWVEEVVKV